MVSEDALRATHARARARRHAGFLSFDHEKEHGRHDGSVSKLNHDVRSPLWERSIPAPTHFPDGRSPVGKAVVGGRCAPFASALAPARQVTVFLRKQEPRATNVPPVTLGSCQRRSTTFVSTR